MIEREIDGPLFNALIYIALGTLLFYLVVDLDWSPRFLVGAVFFIMLSAMSFLDAATQEPATHYRLEATDAGSARFAYATPYRADAETLLYEITGAS